MKQMKLFSLSLMPVLLLVMLTALPIEASKVYTWKDASGVTHYSDKPFPKARDSKSIEIKAARPKSYDDTKDEDKTESSTANSRRTLFDSGDTKRLNAECSKARNNLVTLASGKNIRRTNAQGEEVTLDETGIQAEVQKNQTFISSYCRTNTVNKTNDSTYSSSGDEEDDEGF